MGWVTAVTLRSQAAELTGKRALMHPLSWWGAARGSGGSSAAHPEDGAVLGKLLRHSRATGSQNLSLAFNSSFIFILQ